MTTQAQVDSILADILVLKLLFGIKITSFVTFVDTIVFQSGWTFWRFCLACSFSFSFSYLFLQFLAVELSSLFRIVPVFTENKDLLDRMFKSINLEKSVILRLPRFVTNMFPW